MAKESINAFTSKRIPSRETEQLLTELTVLQLPERPRVQPNR